MLSNKIKNIIKNNDRLYLIARCIKSINDPYYRKLVQGYYEECDNVSLLIEHKGEKYPDKIIYHINILDNKKTTNRSIDGLCALLRQTLLSMSFLDAWGMVPVVEWGSRCVCYDSHMDPITLNAFEYYFEPVAKICSREIEGCKNVIDAFGDHITIVNNFFSEERIAFSCNYHVEQQEIERLAALYKKYIHLNTKTQKYIEGQINDILVTGPILAVHVRGTDFNVGLVQHPIAIAPEEYLETVKQVYAGGKNYKKIFLATDDTNVLKLFKKEFKDKLLYYNDAFRSDGQNGIQTIFSDRPLHHYKLGLEILRDVYTLANCDSLVCGLSNVSFAARYVNLAIGRKFNEVVVIDHGVNEKDSLEAKAYRKKIKKYQPEKEHDFHQDP